MAAIFQTYAAQVVRWSPMAKQSPQDRLRRLSEGRCPVHGTPMTQIGNIPFKGEYRFLASCPRRDCEVQAMAHSPTGPCVLLPQFEHLIYNDHQRQRQRQRQ